MIRTPCLIHGDIEYCACMASIVEHGHLGVPFEAALIKCERGHLVAGVRSNWSKSCYCGARTTVVRRAVITPRYGFA